MTDKAIDPRYEFARQAGNLILRGEMPQNLTSAVSGTGTTIAHIAAHNGKIPDRFDDWSVHDCYGHTVIHTLVRAGFHPPEGFRAWGISEDEVGTVAHLMVSMGRPLPVGFDNWLLRDARGRTVAHAAAMKNSHLLPVDFNDWRAVDEVTGLTVAHTVVANNADFPVKRFLHWDRDVWKIEARSSDWTVAHEAAHRGVLTKKSLRKLFGEDTAAIEGLLNIESVMMTNQPVSVRSLIKERKMLLKVLEAQGTKTLTSILEDKK